MKKILAMTAKDGGATNALGGVFSLKKLQATKLAWMLIFVAVIGTAAAPLVQAQDQASLMKEQQALAKKKNRTPAETQRIMDINIEIMMLNGMTREQAEAMLAQQMGMTDQQRQQQQQQTADLKKGFEQAQEQQRQAELASQQAQERDRQLHEAQLYPGDTRGWPSTAWLRTAFEGKLNSLKQPAGTNASYDNKESVIYLTGANANTLQELKRQIESALGRQMTGSGNSFDGILIEGKRGRFDDSPVQVRIELEGNRITITRWQSAA
jgi:hypothetical protein